MAIAAILWLKIGNEEGILQLFQFFIEKNKIASHRF